MLYQWSGETGIIIIKVLCCFCLFFVIFSSKIGTFWLKFEEEIRRSECRKWRFRASNFKNFLGLTSLRRGLEKGKYKFKRHILFLCMSRIIFQTMHSGPLSQTIPIFCKRTSKLCCPTVGLSKFTIETDFHVSPYVTFKEALQQRQNSFTCSAFFCV